MAVTVWSHAHWPAEYHEHLVALVKADNGGVLPEWAIAADLVYRADLANHPARPVAFPGRRALQEAWGVPERVARRCLADEGWQAKCLAAKIALPARRLDGTGANVPASVPGTSPPPSPPRTEQPATPAASVPASVPGTSPPPSIARVVADPPTHRPTDLSDARTDVRALVLYATQPETISPWDEALEAWAEACALLAAPGGPKAVEIARRGALRLKPDTGMGIGLQARIAKHGATAVRAVIAWYAQSEHQRARFLREAGHGLKTLCRPANFEEYLPWAERFVAQVERGLRPAPGGRRSMLGGLANIGNQRLEVIDGE